MAQKKRKSQSLLNGALVLSVSTLLVKIIGVIYKIPISNMMGAVGRGYFDSAYNLYIPIYTISMAGLPVAVSKMVSQHVALGRYRDVRMIFRVSARLFTFTGILGTVLLLIFAYPYALIAKTYEPHSHLAGYRGNRQNDIRYCCGKADHNIRLFAV